MNIKTITAALVATALSGVVASSSTFAQSYGGGPTCGYGQDYDTVNQRCVSVRGGERGYWTARGRFVPWVGYNR
jgi:hypothetical protein